ncbi:APC family permease [Nicoliella spurrieriana]|uniref:APC family permease n=1 Tax=Nicoliella spurrieriana TaxID=2925830 RepID=A0A976RS82_9LACO|nr:APC family permease [Nicoliella spurrieriana]UQS86937.1 APC family permease [Nicoliella spurrieriana]
MEKSTKLGFWSIVLMGINIIIGSGIFLIPGTGVKLFGPASILVLIFDAFLIFMVGLCFAECASHFNENGGAYVYTRKAFGNFWGYEVGIATWATRIVAEATIYAGLITALSGVFPQLQNPGPKYALITVIGLALITLNVMGIRISKVFNNILTVSKLLPLILLIAVGIFFLKPTNFQPFFPPELTHMSNFSTAAVTLFYVFVGFEGLVVVAGEMKNTKRNLPLALLVVLLSVTIIYSLIFAVSIGVLGTNLSNTPVPLQAVFSTIAGPVGKWIIVVGSILSMGAIVVGSSFVTPRAGVALANHEMMPAFIKKRNRHDAPYIAIVISTCLVMLIAYSGTFVVLAQIASVARFVQYIPTCLSVIRFRKIIDHDPNAFKVPFGILIPVIATVISLWLLINAKHEQLLLAVGFLVVIAPFYFLTNVRKRHVREGKAD